MTEYERIAAEVAANMAGWYGVDPDELEEADPVLETPEFRGAAMAFYDLGLTEEERQARTRELYVRIARAMGYGRGADGPEVSISVP